MDAHPYTLGRMAALQDLGIKVAGVSTIPVARRKDPFTEIYRRLTKAFKIKTPKFDLSAHLKRLMNNPFKQPTSQLSGKLKPLRI